MVGYNGIASEGPGITDRASREGTGPLSTARPRPRGEGS